jgi:hypothetical protein
MRIKEVWIKVAEKDWTRKFRANLDITIERMFAGAGVMVTVIVLTRVTVLRLGAKLPKYT